MQRCRRIWTWDKPSCSSYFTRGNKGNSGSHKKYNLIYTWDWSAEARLVWVHCSLGKHVWGKMWTQPGKSCLHLPCKRKSNFVLKKHACEASRGAGGGGLRQGAGGRGLRVVWRKRGWWDFLEPTLSLPVTHIFWSVILHFFLPWNLMPTNLQKWRCFST